MVMLISLVDWHELECFSPGGPDLSKERKATLTKVSNTSGPYLFPARESKSCSGPVFGRLDRHAEVSVPRPDGAMYDSGILVRQFGRNMSGC